MIERVASVPRLRHGELRSPRDYAVKTPVIISGLCLAVVKSVRLFH